MLSWLVFFQFPILCVFFSIKYREVTHNFSSHFNRSKQFEENYTEAILDKSCSCHTRERTQLFKYMNMPDYKHASLPLHIVQTSCKEQIIKPCAFKI